LSIHANIYLSIFNTGSFALIKLKFQLKWGMLVQIVPTLDFVITFISVFSILGVFCIDWTKVSVERWPHCHVRYWFISSFSFGPKWFCKRFLFNVYNVFQFFFIKTRF